MSAIACVIFDLDDTLYPERDYAFSGFAAVAAVFENHLGDRPEVTDHMRRLFDTQHRPRVFNALLEQRGLPDDERLVIRMIETYRNHRPAIALHSDADTALTRLRSRYKLGLITDGPRVSQWAKIDALGLRSRLDAIILTDELGAEFVKPHSRPFELIARQIGVGPAHSVYVADNPAKDFIAPNRLGWAAVRIRRPGGIYDEAPTAEGGVPRHVINTLDDLDAII